jgi:uncharacterized protein (TIGR02996 family)
MATETDLAGVLRNILDNPPDDAPRLIYADVLDDLETGMDGLDSYAKFIRLQIEMSREKRKTYQAKISKKINELMRGAVGFRSFPWLNHILDDLGLGFGADGYKYVHLDINFSRVQRDESYERKGECHIGRGFVKSLRVSEKYFLANAKRLFECQPITSVAIDDRSASATGNYPEHFNGFVPLQNYAFFESDEIGEPSHHIVAASTDAGRYSVIDRNIFEEMARLCDVWIAGRNPTDGGVACFSSQQRATQAISAACVAYGRKLAGLTAMNTSGSGTVPRIIPGEPWRYLGGALFARNEQE